MKPSSAQLAYLRSAESGDLYVWPYGNVEPSPDLRRVVGDWIDLKAHEEGRYHPSIASGNRMLQGLWIVLEKTTLLRKTWAHGRMHTRFMLRAKLTEAGQQLLRGR